MSYNFDFAVSASINAKTVEEMIRKCVEEQTGRKVKRVDFKTSQGYDCMDRPTGTQFDGCTVHFDGVVPGTTPWGDTYER